MPGAAFLRRRSAFAGRSTRIECRPMEAASPLSANNRGKKILLVDDDQALRTVLAEQLDLYDGFTTIQVGTAAEGLEKAKLAHYDAVLLDIGLPTWTAASSAS